jgi:photosystem II stability/assembly factor-like uncharacterized protein
VNRVLTAAPRRTLFAVGGAAGAALLGLSLATGLWPAGSSQLTPVPSITHAVPHNHLHGLAYVPQEGLYLATHYGLFLLRDGELFQVGDIQDDLMGFSRHPGDPETFYASGHPQTGGNMGVIVSRDGGVSWEQVFTGVGEETVDFHSMVASPADPGRLYGAFGGRIYVGDLATGDWRLAAAEGLNVEGFCWGVPCLAAAADDADRLFAANPQGIHVSTDAGETWTRLPGETGMAAGLGAHPERPQVLMAFTEAHGVALSQDRGASWAPRNEGIGLPERDFLFGFAFDPESDRVFTASSGGLVFESENLGESWRLIHRPDGPA